MIEVDYTKITKKEIEDMLYLISAYANKKEARRFDGLSFARRQQVTFILKSRASRAYRHHQPIDLFIVREVIDDAQKGVFIFDDA